MTATDEPVAEVGQRRAAQVLQALKRYRHVSDNELATALERSRSSVQGYVAGTNQLTIGLLYDFARVLGVDPAVFLMEPSDALRWAIDNNPNSRDEGGGSQAALTRCYGLALAAAC
jgi:plasmid maintenance system antidote protein VapI